MNNIYNNYLRIIYVIKNDERNTFCMNNQDISEKCYESNENKIFFTNIIKI